MPLFPRQSNLSYCLGTHDSGATVGTGASFSKININSIAFSSGSQDFAQNSGNIICYQSGIYLVSASMRLNVDPAENANFSVRLTESNTNILFLSVANGSRISQISNIFTTILQLSAGAAIGFEAQHGYSSGRATQTANNGTSISLALLSRS